jgi:hypothetical protein
MEQDVRESLLWILRKMQIETAFLQDCLLRTAAVRQVLEDQGLLSYTEYTAAVQKASLTDDSSLLGGHLREIDEMIQSLSGTGRIQ